MRAKEFVAETASAGASSSGSVATVAVPIGAMITRTQPTRSTKYRNTYKGSKPNARR
jgi:hypothetical protein